MAIKKREKTPSLKIREVEQKIGKKLLLMIFIMLCLYFILPLAYAVDVTGCTNINSPGTYNLTGDITESTTPYCINISANNVVLDCQGHLIDGDDTADYGIYVYRNSFQITNITIKNCNVSDWNSGNIYFYQANNNTIENVNSYSSPYYGIYLYKSSNNTLTNNTANNNNRGIYLYFSSTNILTNNTANSNTYDGIVLWSSAQYNTLSNNTANNNNQYGIQLYSSSNNKITNNTANNNNRGIYLDRSYSNTLTNNTANSNTQSGIYLSSSSSNTLSNNSADNNKYGIYLDRSYSNTLISNTANSNNPYGIYLSSSTSNTLSNNTANNNTNYGIFLSSSSNNNIIGNTASLNTQGGIAIWWQGQNKLTNNTVNNNKYGIYIYDSSNNNTLTNNTANNNTQSGIYLYLSSSNTLSSNTANDNTQDGIYLNSSSNNNITSNTANNNINNGLYLTSDSTSNTINSNIFCSNGQKDIYDGDSNTGDNNTGNTWYNWADMDLDYGMTFACPNTSFAVTSNSPTNNHYTNDTTPDFIFTVSGNIAMYFCELFINGIGYGTNTSTQNNTPTVITANASLSEGLYQWQVKCTYGGITNSSSLRNITIDTPPTIQFVPPTETSGSTINRRYIQVNVTASDSVPGLKNITTYLYNSTSLLNSTPSTNSPFFVNFTGLSEGTYYFNSTACDNAGNCNSTETRNVTIDTISPIATLTIKDTSISKGSITDVSCSGTDANMKNVSLTIDGSKVCTGTSSCSYTYNPSTTGIKAVSCLVYDKAGNSDTATGEIKVTSSTPTTKRAAGGFGGIPKFSAPIEHAFVISRFFEEVEQTLEVPDIHRTPTDLLSLTAKFLKSSYVDFWVAKVSLPEGISQPPVSLYSLIEIVTTRHGTDEKVKAEKQFLSFRINRDWIEGGKYGKDVSVFAWDGKNWKELEVEQIGSDDSFYYFKTDATGYGILAIGAKPIVPAPTPTPTPTPTPAPTPTPTPSTPTQTPTPTATPTQWKIPGFEAPLAIIALLVIAYLIRRKS